MFGRKIKILSLAVLFIFFSGQLFALEEYVSEVYKQIDNCFSAKDEDKLNSVLARKRDRAESAESSVIFFRKETSSLSVTAANTPHNRTQTSTASTARIRISFLRFTGSPHSTNYRFTIIIKA